MAKMAISHQMAYVILIIEPHLTPILSKSSLVLDLSLSLELIPFFMNNL